MSARDPLERILDGRRATARRVLWFERIWPALWPALAVLGGWLTLALFDVTAALPGWWHAGALLLLLVAVVGLAWRGLRRVRAPSPQDVDRRLEAASGLRHRPLMTLTDSPASRDADAAALWQAHRARAAAQVARLRVGWPHPVLAQSDQMAVRGLLVVAFAAGLMVAGPDAPGRMLRSFLPALPAGPQAPEPQLQVWITPPAYTRLPPMFLKRDTAEVEVPAGSALTVSLTGGTEAPALSLAGAAVAFKPLDAASWQADQPVGQGGALVVRRGRQELGHWALAIHADQPPTVAWAEAPGPGRAQRRLATRLPWTAQDDYGLAAVQVELRLRDRRDASPVILKLPIVGAPKQAHGVPSLDLTANPWAGLPVVAVLVATDAPGQTGSSPAAEFVLPERGFHNPLARAVIDIRKRLSADPSAHVQAAEDLAALAGAPAAFDNSTTVFLALSNTASQLQRSGAEPDIAEAQARLWALALSLDDDAVGRTAQAMQQAREALKQAEHGPLTELDKKAEALRQAIQKHLQALAEKAQRDGTLLPFDPQTRTLTSNDFNKLTQQMRDAAKAGRMDEAHGKMEQLERMLEQLKQAEANPGDRKQSAQQRRRGKQEMGAAEDMVQRETTMKQRGQERAGKPDADPAQRETDAAQQRAMRRALGAMMQQFGDLTGKVPPELGQADLAMRDSANALQKGQDGPAADAQQRAIDALQKGQQAMSQQMASSLGISLQPGEGEGEGEGNGEATDGQMTQDDGDGQPGGRGQRDADGGDGQGRDADSQRDPLGRATKDGTAGRADSGDVHVPDQMEQARTRDIQAELRRRGADRSRSADELDYIDRLLKSF